LGTVGGRQDMEELGASSSYKDRAKFMVSWNTLQAIHNEL
jgi:hypothetical protein